MAMIEVDDGEKEHSQNNQNYGNDSFYQLKSFPALRVVSKKKDSKQDEKNASTQKGSIGHNFRNGLNQNAPE